MKPAYFWAAVAVYVGIMYSSFAEAEMVFICHRDVPVNALSKKDIKKIFLAQSKAWKGNKLGIVFVNQEEKQVFKEFASTYLRMSPARYQSYFRKKMFTGRGQRPKSFKNDQRIIEYVSKTEGAIGYISPGIELKDNSVKKITVK